MRPVVTAILVDGGFFIKRYRTLTRDWQAHTPKDVADTLRTKCLEHLNQVHLGESFKASLYRIFYYDCPPMDKRVQHPITRRGINLGNTDAAMFRLDLFEELKAQRKTALRLGYLSKHSDWEIKPPKLRELIFGKCTMESVTEDDVQYVSRQKGVDMKLGIDIASLAYEGIVNQIILMTGDSDFVPAAKLARRKGIDVVLDPMWQHINTDLNEHIDGIRTTWPHPVDSSDSQI